MYRLPSDFKILNKEEISTYLHDTQIERCTFNIIQHHPITEEQSLRQRRLASLRQK